MYGAQQHLSTVGTVGTDGTSGRTPVTARTYTQMHTHASSLPCASCETPAPAHTSRGTCIRNGSDARGQGTRGCKAPACNSRGARARARRGPCACHVQRASRTDVCVCCRWQVCTSRAGKEQSATGNQQPATGNPRATSRTGVCVSMASVNVPRWQKSNQRPATSNRQPATHDQRATSNRQTDQRPPTDPLCCQRPCVL